MLATVASYESNGLHWRTLRDNGVYERDLFYYSSDWQLLEEHRIAHEGNPATGSLVRVAQQFWGLRYIDDAVARRVDADADGYYNNGGGSSEEQVPGEGTWFHLTDVQFSVVALLDDIAVLAERVRYDAYGRARHRWPTDLDGDGDADNDDYFDQLGAASTTIHGTNYNPDADHDRDGDVDNNDFSTFLLGAGRAALTYGLISDAVAGPDNPIGYDGYVFAPEAGIVVGEGGGQAQAVGAYCVRFRWYVPETGRWLEGDPAGYVDGMGLFEFAGSSGPSRLDPLGLDDVCGLDVLIWTGYWCVDEEVWAAADEAFYESSWDRTNGTLDALSFNSVDLEDVYGVDWTFDEVERANAECVAECIADNLVNSLLPLPPFLETSVFSDGQVIGLTGDNPLDWAPGSFDLIGRILERMYRGKIYYKWKVTTGRLWDDLGPRSFRGTNRQRMAQRLRKAGEWGDVLLSAWNAFVGCRQQCTEEATDCDASASVAPPPAPIPSPPAQVNDWETRPPGGRRPMY